MSRIIRVIIRNSLHQNKNREEVKNNKYPNYPAHRLYFGEFETAYTIINTLPYRLGRTSKR